MKVDDPFAGLTYPGESSLGTDVTLLPITPQRVLATWSGASLSPGGNGNGEGGGYCLRVHDVSNVDFVGNNPHRGWVYELQEGQTGCVVELDRPGLTLCAELTRRTGDDGSLSVARSRRLQMPLNGEPRPMERVHWMICERPNGRR